MEYVWYLSYGSNMYQERFMCYIEGRKYRDNALKEQGCKDSTHPLDSRGVMIRNQLYFAKSSSRWQDMAVSFITSSKSNERTFAKMYLITKDQFEDVVKQENRIDVNNEIAIDYDLLEREGKQLMYPDKYYGLILKIDEIDGYPVYSFTHPTDLKETRKPSIEYLSSLMYGVRENFEVNDEFIVSNFLKKDGIKGHFSQSDLYKILK